MQLQSLSLSLTPVLRRLSAGIVVSFAVTGCAKTVPSTVSPAPAYSFTTQLVGRGTPMILIPGLFSSARVWDGVVAHYRTRYEVHVLQLPGFAGHAPVADSALLERVASDLESYIRARKLTRPVLVGHSLGGLVALKVALRAPSLVGPIVSVDGLPYAVAIQVPGATPETMRATADAIRTGYRQLNPQQLEAQVRQGMAMMTSTPSFADTLAAWARRSDAATVGNVLAEAVSTDLRGQVSRIPSPILLLGTYAQAPDAESRVKVRSAYDAQVASIPRHELRMADNSKHFIMIDDLPWLVREMDAFLSSAAR
jgi:N-formylmaleamate deformylase